MQNSTSENYLQRIVAGKSIYDWLTTGNQFHSRNVQVWYLIHICLSFYFEYGPFINADDFGIMDRITRCIPAAFQKQLPTNFLEYLYHWVVGTYGHVNYYQTYMLEIVEAREHLEGGQTYVLFLPPLESKDAIPFPVFVIPPTPPSTSSEENG